MAIVVHQRTFWEMYQRLTLYEGWSCSWRLPVAAVAWLVGPLIVVGAGVAGAAVAGDDFGWTTAAAGATLGFLGQHLLGARLTESRLHDRVLRGRLASWERLNPPSEVVVLVATDDADVARTALAQAGFNPFAHASRVGSPPLDAPELNFKIGVHEPAAHLQSLSAEDRLNRIRSVLTAASIRARIGGMDVFPGNRASAHRN